MNTPTVKPEGVDRLSDFKCPVCASHYFGPLFEQERHVGRYCKGWPSGHGRSYSPCRGKHEERFAPEESKVTTNPMPLPEPVQRLLRYAGQTMRTARNPNLTAREAIEVWDWISATIASAAAPVQGVPEGWCVYATTGFDALLQALDRADRKGYMPDAMADEWQAFDYRALPATPPARLPEKTSSLDDLPPLI